MEFTRIKEARINLNLTQKEIANILGVQRGTYASWECGNDTIPTKQLYKFANYIGKSIDYLLELNNKDKKIACKKDINLIKLGENILKIREKLNLSQLKFAQSININQSTLWGYEKGKTLITTASLISLANTYNISIDKLFDRI